MDKILNRHCDMGFIIPLVKIRTYIKCVNGLRPSGFKPLLYKDLLIDWIIAGGPVEAYWCYIPLEFIQLIKNWFRSLTSSCIRTVFNLKGLGLPLLHFDDHKNCQEFSLLKLRYGIACSIIKEQSCKT